MNTPLTHRSAADSERRRDSVHLTVGAHLELGERTWLSLAAATPVTRPRLLDAEALARLNWGSDPGLWPIGLLTSCETLAPGPTLRGPMPAGLGGTRQR